MADKSIRKQAEEFQAQTRDVAHKIWLAGIGAYGRAFDETKSNIENFSGNTTDFFEDLVKRGEAIESDVTSRIASNERLQTASQRVQKAVETATQFQEKQMERFEERMERMRGLLGVSSGSDKASKLHAKLDKLEDEVASLRADEDSPAGNKALKARLQRLTSEIDAIVEEKAPAPKKTAAKAKTTAKKKTVKKAPAKKAAKKA